jgi:excisionase family DNA binding protein
MNDILTLEDVAERLMISVAKVKGLLKSGKLPCIQIGVDVRIPEESLQNFLVDNLRDWKPCKRGSKR